MMRGRGIRSKSRFVVPVGSGTSLSMFAQVAGSSGNLKLARRNLVHVLPDLGNETKKMSSGRMSRLRFGLYRPRPRFTPAIRCLTIGIRTSSADLSSYENELRHRFKARTESLR